MLQAWVQRVRKKPHFITIFTVKICRISAILVRRQEQPKNITETEKSCEHLFAMYTNRFLWSTIESVPGWVRWLAGHPTQSATLATTWTTCHCSALRSSIHGPCILLQIAICNCCSRATHLLSVWSNSAVSALWLCWAQDTIYWNRD